MLFSKRLFSLALGFFLIAAVITSTSKAQQLTPQIAFVSDRDGNQEIYVMSVDGSNATNLTNNDADDFAPSWSPDGTKLLFASDRDGNQEIYLMSADGSNATNLTNNAADDFAPSWSPDGTKILFLSNRDQKSQLYTMQADGTDPQLLVKDSPVFVPSWSPDGKYVAYAVLGGSINMSGAGVVFVGGNAGAYVVGSDGSTPKQLTENYVLFTGPIWSPDSKQIAVLEVSSQSADVVLVGVDGGNKQKLSTEWVTYNLSWSPDGTQIVFGTSEMTLIDVKTGQQKPLGDKKFTLNIVQKAVMGLTGGELRFDRAGIPLAPVWSADGKQILFTAEDGGKSDIYIINVDGSNLTNLTDNAAMDTDALFQPQPSSE